MTWTYLWNKKQIHRHREHTCGCQGGWGRGGVEWEFGICRCKLLNIGWMNNKVLRAAQEPIFNILLFSRSVVSNSSWPQGLQHARLLCLPLSPGVCSNPRPLSQWRHPTITSSDTPFSSSCRQSFPASGSFLISQLFTSGDQSIGASASASDLPMNIQGWYYYPMINYIGKEYIQIYIYIYIYMNERMNHCCTAEISTS